MNREEREQKHTEKTLRAEIGDRVAWFAYNSEIPERTGKIVDKLLKHFVIEWDSGYRSIESVVILPYIRKYDGELRSPKKNDPHTCTVCNGYGKLVKCPDCHKGFISITGEFDVAHYSMMLTKQDPRWNPGPVNETFRSKVMSEFAALCKKYKLKEPKTPYELSYDDLALLYKRLGAEAINNWAQGLVAPSSSKLPAPGRVNLAPFVGQKVRVELKNGETFERKLELYEGVYIIYLTGEVFSEFDSTGRCFGTGRTYSDGGMGEGSDIISINPLERVNKKRGH